MSDEKKKKIIEEIKKREKKIYTEGVNFTNCPIHGIRYPEGGECPVCSSGKKR